MQINWLKFKLPETRITAFNVLNWTQVVEARTLYTPRRSFPESSEIGLGQTNDSNGFLRGLRQASIFDCENAVLQTSYKPCDGLR